MKHFIFREFRIIDDDRNNSLSFEEFSKGCDDFGAHLTKEEKRQIFDQVDIDKSGQLSFDEFLLALRVHFALFFVYVELMCLFCKLILN